MTSESLRRIDVLDKGYVELQDMMGDDLAIVNAARVSFLGESKGDEADKKLLNYLMKHKHSTPFEQAIMKFRIKAPVVVWWQLVRHRTARINLQSGRYMVFEEDEFYTPDEDQWRKQSASNKQGSDGVLDVKWDGQRLTNALQTHIEASYRLYDMALQKGVAKEQARLFLPAWASYYVGIVQFDAHNLMNFLRLRTAPDAQYEIRQYADAMHAIFKEVLPWTEAAFRT